MYHISNFRKPYFPDLLEITSQTDNEENPVRARMVINVPVYVSDDLRWWESNFERKLQAARLQKNLIAQTEGARELAAEEGFVPDPESAAESRTWEQSEDGDSAALIPGG